MPENAGGLFLKVFGVALAVAFLGMLLAGQMGVTTAPLVLVLGWPMFPAYLWLWPMMRILPADPSSIILPAVIGWLVYGGIGLAAVRTTNRSVQTSLFVLFVILLCANIAGCWSGASF